MQGKECFFRLNAKISQLCAFDNINKCIFIMKTSRQFDCHVYVNKITLLFALNKLLHFQGDKITIRYNKKVHFIVTKSYCM